MIGNDIIDLKEASRQSNIFRRGYLEKLFSAKELESILLTGDTILRTWIYWAMKESAYKAHQRRFNLARSYRPLDFNCEIDNVNTKDLTGNVRTGKFIYDATITVQKEYIHCKVAENLSKTEFCSEIFSDKKDIKNEILIKYSSFKNLPVSKLSIIKDHNSVPHLFYNRQVTSQAFSISHHGNFSAYVLALINY